MRAPITLLLIATLAGAREASAQEPKGAPRFAGVDLFGTERLTIDAVRAQLGERMDAFAAKQLGGALAEAAPLQKELEEKIRALGDFAFVKFSIVQYSRPGWPYYLTIDVVEKADAARRMAFDPEPTRDLPDPGGALARYGEYERIGFELWKSRELKPDPDAQKSAFHAPFGFAHARLAPYREVLPRDAEAHHDALVEILHGDRDPQRRAWAAFLLAFGHDGARLVKELTPSVRDPSALVRNNALRVFAEIADNHPTLELPLETVLQALDFPTATDRNKASAILAALSQRPALKDEIGRRASRTLLAMLKLEQPNNHDYAWIILKNVSGESFGERDYVAWQAWVDAHAAKPPAPEKQ